MNKFQKALFNDSRLYYNADPLCIGAIPYKQKLAIDWLAKNEPDTLYRIARDRDFEPSVFLTDRENAAITEYLDAKAYKDHR